MFETENAGPDVAEDNSEKPEWDLLGLSSWSTYSVWEGKEIVVTVNDTHLLDRPATQEFQIAWKFSYVGCSKEIHVCFAKNIALECFQN